MLTVSQVWVVRAIQAGFSVFLHILRIPERFLTWWCKRSQAHHGPSLPVGLGPLIAMLWVGMPGALLTWACAGSGSPHSHGPFGASVMTGLALVVLTIARRVSATTIRELWNDKVYHLCVLQGSRHTWGHTVRSWVERKRTYEQAWAWGSALLGSRAGCLALLGLLSTGEFKV